MRKIAHYDRGLCTRAATAELARLLTKYFPLALLLVVCPVGSVLLAYHHGNSTADISILIPVLWSTSFLFALTLNWIGNYFLAEPGRLTYDRVSTVLYNFIPWTPKGVAVLFMLFADCIYIPMLLFSHREVLPGTPLEKVASTVLLQNPAPYVINGDGNSGDGHNHHHGDAAASTTTGNLVSSAEQQKIVYPALFWCMFVVGALFLWIGLCCIVPVLPYPGGAFGMGPAKSGGGCWEKLRANRSVIAYTVSLMVGPLLMHVFLRTFPCDNVSGAGDHMLAWHQMYCDSKTHSTYMILAALLVLSFGLPLFSAIQQLMNLDNSFDAMDIYAVKVDPVPLGVITFSRGIIVICTALQVPSRVMMGCWMLTQLAAFISVIFIRFSSVIVLNQMARLSTALGAWSSLWVAILLVVNTYHYDHLPLSRIGHKSIGGGGGGEGLISSSSSSSHFYEYTDIKVLAVDITPGSVCVQVVWGLGYSLMVLLSIFYHCKKRGFQFFDNSHEEEPVLEDFSADVYF